MGKTFIIIKPHVFEHAYAVINFINQSGFCVQDLTEIKIDPEVVKEHYRGHENGTYYPGLLRSMEGNCYAAFVSSIDSAESDADTISSFRKFLGSTDPKMSKHHTIRAIFGTELPFNACHASDSIEAVEREARLWLKIHDTPKTSDEEVIASPEELSIKSTMDNRFDAHFVMGVEYAGRGV